MVAKQKVIIVPRGTIRETAAEPNGLADLKCDHESFYRNILHLVPPIDTIERAVIDGLVAFRRSPE